MTRFLLAAATAAGLLATAAPAANACDLEHCPWSAPVCREIGCQRPFVECVYTQDFVLCV